MLIIGLPVQYGRHDLFFFPETINPLSAQEQVVTIVLLLIIT